MKGASAEEENHRPVEGGELQGTLTVRRGGGRHFNTCRWHRIGHDLFGAQAKGLEPATAPVPVRKPVTPARPGEYRLGTGEPRIAAQGEAVFFGIPGPWL